MRRVEHPGEPPVRRKDHLYQHYVEDFGNLKDLLDIVPDHIDPEDVEFYKDFYYKSTVVYIQWKDLEPIDAFKQRAEEYNKKLNKYNDWVESVGGPEVVKKMDEEKTRKMREKHLIKKEAEAKRIQKEIERLHKKLESVKLS